MRFCICLLIFSGAHAQVVITDKMHHLRNSATREWSSFAEQSERELLIDFNVKKPDALRLLRVRQRDVKQSWVISINGLTVGILITDEKDLTHYVSIPEKVLLRGKNSLRIESRSSTPDDISVGNLALESDLPEIQSGVLHLTVLDSGSGRPIPSRLTILDENRSMRQVWPAKNEEQLAVRPGCVYSSTGIASIKIAAGQYKIFASRGFEYSVDSLSISVGKGEEHKTLRISREVDTGGWISSDTHVHTFSHSGHGDATERERVITLAGEGIELPIVTDHNQHIDLSSAANSIGVNDKFTLVTGNELTTKVGHFNIFPTEPSTAPIDPKVESWRELLGRIPLENRVVILNHANDIHNEFRPFGQSRHISLAGADRNGWPFPANAMEVVNSGSQQTDLNQLFEQWMGMLNGGHVITPIGSSDSHDVSRYIVGQGRTYVRGDDREVSRINVAEAVENFLAGKVMVSCGLLAKISLDEYGPGDLSPGSKSVSIKISVEGPSWVGADRVALYMNGFKIREQSISPSASTVKWAGTWQVDGPSRDVFMNVVATGPGNNIPFWPIEKPYQPQSPDWTPRVIGLSGAIWIDGDGDGRRSTANDYAKYLLHASKGNIAEVFTRMKSYDSAVAGQVAVLMANDGIDLWSREVESLLVQLNSDLQRGFREVRNELKKR